MDRDIKRDHRFQRICIRLQILFMQCIEVVSDVTTQRYRGKCCAHGYRQNLMSCRSDEMLT